MTAPNTRACLVCGNNNVKILRRVEEVAGEKRIQCARCGAIYFTRTPEEKASYDYAYNAHFFRPGDISKAGIMATKLGDFCQKTLHNPRVLEAGAGNGLTIFLLHQQGIDTEGVDLNQTWCSHLSYTFSISVHSARFEKFTPLHDYDLVYSSHTIEHVESPYAFMRKAYDILVPGGYFWLDTPDTYFWEKCPQRWHHFETRHPFEHLCLLSLESIEHLAKSTGFRITDWERQHEYNSLRVIMRKPEAKKE